MLGVVSSGLSFYAASTLLRDADRDKHVVGNSAPSIADTLQTLQSVSAIMFTNSLVNYAMRIVSPGWTFSVAVSGMACSASAPARLMKTFLVLAR